MTDLQKLQRACRVFLARLLLVYGPAAADLLRLIADELEWLEVERVERRHRCASQIRACGRKRQQRY